jgi:hypothetical protein
MKSIWRRLMYYGIGLLIGLLFVTFFFGNRGCSWLPENRIKSSIFSQVLVVDTAAMVEGFTDSMYVVTIVEADVNLGLSLRQGEPKAYYFANKKKGNKARFFQVTFETDGVVGIVKTIPEDQKAKIQTGNYSYPIIHVPGDSNFISFHEGMERNVQLLNLNRQIIHNALKNTGFAQTENIDFDPDKRKIHRMIFEHKGNQYRITVRYFQNSLQLMGIEEIFN